MITLEEAGQIFRDQLAGFDRYPKPDTRFIEVLQESTVSVDHARAVVQSFERGGKDFPQLADIRDTARNLRPRFDAVIPPEVEWRRRYGKPAADWSKNLTGSHEQQKSRLQWQAIRDSLFYVEGPGESEDPSFWTASLIKLRERHPAEVLAVESEICRRGWVDIMREDWASEIPVGENS